MAVLKKRLVREGDEDPEDEAPRGAKSIEDYSFEFVSSDDLPVHTRGAISPWREPVKVWIEDNFKKNPKKDVFKVKVSERIDGRKVGNRIRSVLQDMYPLLEFGTQVIHTKEGQWFFAIKAIKWLKASEVPMKLDKRMRVEE